MRGLKYFAFAFMLVLTSSIIVNASVIQIKNSDYESADINTAELPQWTVGNYWKYAMDFVFIVRNGATKKFSVDATIDDMYAVLTDIEVINSEELYILSLDGNIFGKISLFEAEIDIADFQGDFGGYAQISKNTLGIKKFIFEVDGRVNIPLLGWRDMYFEMIMDFSLSFDFFDFPICVDEEPWDVLIEEASLEAYVDIDIPFGENDFSSSMVFNDVMSVNWTEQVTVPAGTYDSIVISGTWGHLSHLWYAPDVGYLAKVDESLYWEDGRIESVFHLNLLETNYDVENSPPNPPDKAYGETNGVVEQEYTYTTQSSDPNQDNIYYLFDWGDETDSGWVGPCPSGSPVSSSHMWYNKGMFNVIVKAKDESGIESEWSEPLSVTIKGDPKLIITVDEINQIDSIDLGTEPELYYTIAATCEGTSSPPQTYCNTDDGTYNGEWNSVSSWHPDKDHEFTAYSRNVTITLKLMDYDSMWELGSDDLADTSGCIGDGKDNDIGFKRGAIYHGTYDMVTKQLKPYQTGDPDENADYTYKQNGYYITSGDYQPDNSETSDCNDAKIKFKPSSDYVLPRANALLMRIDGDIRPMEQLQFIGTVQDGTPDYSWNWDFGDGEKSNLQNPTHIYNSIGTYTIILKVTDGFYQTDSCSIQIVVTNNKPILSNDKVTWTGKGKIDDIFTFSVHYLDPDGDGPVVKDVVIDEKSYSLKGFGSNSYYTLNLQGKQIGKGNHKYYFSFDDGFGGTVQTSEKSFSVSSNPKPVTKIFDVFNDKLNKLFPNLSKFMFLFFK